MMTNMKLVESADDGTEKLLEVFESWTLGRPEVLRSWKKAAPQEKARWERAGQLLEARVSGGAYDLVEQLVRDRSFTREPGIYFAPGNDDSDLVYAARRLQQAGMKVAYIDWQPRHQAVEELADSDIPVVDVLKDIEPRQGAEFFDGGTVQLNLEKGENGWMTMTEQTGDLIDQLESLDVVILAVELEDLDDVPQDVWAMSVGTVGDLAGRFGASVLVSGELDNSQPAIDAWSALFLVLNSSMYMSLYTASETW